MAVIMSKQMVLPVMGKLLSDYAEGDTVYLNESGNPVLFYVAKHNYEESLNGAGRTLLVRVDSYGSRGWNSSKVNTYANSAIDTWLNGTYKGVFDADIQSAIGTTTFKYTIGNGNSNLSTLSRSIFVLSLAEMGYGGAPNTNSEGSALPIASTLRGKRQWTRTPPYNSTANVYVWTGTSAYSTSCTSVEAVFPAFTLSGGTKFDPVTNKLLEVA